MNNQITGNTDPYGQICAYACPTTEWKEKPFVLPEELQKGWNIPRIEAGNGYVVSGDMVVFYEVDTPEKRMKLIEAYEKLK